MNKINVAVLGLGEMGATHVKAAKESPFVDKIIGYEPDKQRACPIEFFPAKLNKIVSF